MGCLGRGEGTRSRGDVCVLRGSFVSGVTSWRPDEGATQGENLTNAGAKVQGAQHANGQVRVYLADDLNGAPI